MSDYNYAAAVVLAGGKGSRMGYVEKALIMFDNAPLLMQTLKKLSQVVDTIIVALRDDYQRENFSKLFPSVVFVTDRYHNMGPLAGIEAGLAASNKEYTLVVGCDMPFINTDVIKYLLHKCRGFDVTIPRWDDGKLEPLHAVYRTSVIREEIGRCIKHGERFILAPVFKRKLIQYIDVCELTKFDLTLDTFKNVNTETDVNSIV
ncbi:MAG: NTP transferase domain-containing protein [Methanosarcinales archaeon]|uniref:Probable molybdenum cofactor guanylyltransferase n=1 Tax=Candidatus Ethanoperedens thermophilum TaxID=2766897 RepID=A0A848DAT5_9EURY|nr:NTP transferase domain-containing protein [Candidatus Ethanoperedens thermophilum]